MATEGAATEELPLPEVEGPPPVLMSQEDYQKIVTAMTEYKKIEMAYLRLRSNVTRRVLLTFLVADIILFAALWLGFTGWRGALAWAAVAFAAEEGFMASITYIAEKVKRAP